MHQSNYPITRLSYYPILRSRVFFVLAAIAATNLQLFAHDMWIEPTTFSPQAGKVIGVKLRVGQDLLGDPVPRDPALINQFVVVDSAGRKPVAGPGRAGPPRRALGRGPWPLLLPGCHQPKPGALPPPT